MAADGVTRLSVQTLNYSRAFGWSKSGIASHLLGDQDRRRNNKIRMEDHTTTEQGSRKCDCGCVDKATFDKLAERVQKLEQLVTMIGAGPSRGNGIAEALFDEMERRAAIPAKKCTFCGKEYLDACNHDKACTYHPGPVASTQHGYRLECCGQDIRSMADAGHNPCLAHHAPHREEHVDPDTEPNAMYTAWCMETVRLGRELCAFELNDAADGWVKRIVVGRTNAGDVYTGLKFGMIKWKRMAVSADAGRTAGPVWAVVDGAASFSVAWTGPATLEVRMQGAQHSTPYIHRATIGTDTVEVETTEPDEVANPPAATGTLPADVTEGDVIDVGEQGTPEEHAAEGDSLLSVAQAGPVDPTMDGWARRGKFCNYIISTLALTNPTDATIAVTDYKGEYQDADGVWQPALRCVAGTPYTNNWGESCYNWLEPGDAVRLQAHDKARVAFSVVLEIEGEPGSDNASRRRHHKSLPSPLRTRVTLSDDSERVKSVVTEHFNPPLQLKTKADAVKDKKVDGEPLLWVAVDDVDRETRLWALAYPRKDEPGTITVAWPGREVFLGPALFDKLALNAAADVVPVGGMGSWREGDLAVEVSVCVDRAARRCFGVQVEVSTATGRAVRSFRL